MSNSMEMPMSVYVLYHKDYAEGKEIHKDLYHLLCRNPERPLTDGIDIPVFLRTGGDGQSIPTIKLKESSKNAIFLLVDELMYCCPLWKEYIKSLLDSKDDNTKIYPISLFKYAYDVNSDLRKQQFIVLKSFSIKENWTEFKTRIFDVLIRFINEKETEKLKLFISHSKKEFGNFGEIKAKELRDFLRTDTKLDSFFDTNDILDGHDFERQISDNVENSLFIILETNTYSEREWCRIEALASKKNKVPGIVVNLVSGAVKRGFPYMGNIPVIRYNQNWREIINLLLGTALNQYFQQQLLNVINEKHLSDNYFTLPFAPELFSFSLIDKDKSVLYPEPPLGSEEIKFLESFEKGKLFVTPVQAYSNISKSLTGKNIAISISEPDDIQDYGGDQTLIRDITIELSRHILVAGGKLIYGGDLRKQGFTDLFAELSGQYGQLEKTNRDTKYFTNYFAWPIYLQITSSHKTEFEYKRVFTVCVEPSTEIPKELKNDFISPNTIKNKYFWAKSLSKMREEMEEKANARILLGGQTHGFKGKYVGILEEFIVSQKEGKPIFILGGFGGASRFIIDILMGGEGNTSLFDEAKKDSSYEEFLNFYNKKNNDNKIDYEAITEEIHSNGIKGLNNNLSDEENKQLFESTNVLEIVALILKGLNNKFQTE